MALDEMAIINFLLDSDDDSDEVDDILETAVVVSLCKSPRTQVTHEFNLPKFEESSKLHFRFDYTDLPRLCRALRLPKNVTLPNRLKFTGMEGMCIFLKRMASAGRYIDMQPLFDRPRDELGRIFNWTLQHMYTNFKPLLHNFTMPWFSHENLIRYADAITLKGVPLPLRVFGFLDCTLQQINRPKKMQKAVYTGHKRYHALKFQAITTPDGLISSISDPYPGSQHDARVYSTSALYDDLTRLSSAEEILSLYGDAAYPLSAHLVVPYRGSAVTSEQLAFNKQMSKVRLAVEWSFGKVANIWSYVDYRKNLKLGLQPVGLYYHVAVLLTNIHTCLYGSETGAYFNLAPPGLENYLAAAGNISTL